MLCNDFYSISMYTVHLFCSILCVWMRGDWGLSLVAFLNEYQSGLGRADCLILPWPYVVQRTPAIQSDACTLHSFRIQLGEKAKTYSNMRQAISFGCRTWIVVSIATYSLGAAELYFNAADCGAPCFDMNTLCRAMIGLLHSLERLFKIL